MKTFDAIIIGAGQAGPSLAARLTAAGQTVAFVERKLFGGTCVNTGCTPTKAMIASAYAAHVARRSGDYGVSIDTSIEVDMKAVNARREGIVAKSRNGVEASLRNNPKVMVFKGTARFESATSGCGSQPVRHTRRAFLDQQQFACAGHVAEASRGGGRKLCRH
jgi:pyruvate/2-oxoglutarate dehydrogenase complex dihydrolipoamide dehydrogenase (E3) component